MDFSEIVEKRRACKKFDGRKIPQAKLDALFEIIRLSPSSYNLQPWKIKVVADSETKERLFPFSKSQAQVTTCSHLLVFCADTDAAGLVRDYEKMMEENGVARENIEAAVKLRRESLGRKTPAEMLSWAKNQVFLALGNALNGAKALGFDSCPMEGFDKGAYAKILELPENLVPAVLCPVGYAADEPRKKMRLAGEMVFF